MEVWIDWINELSQYSAHIKHVKSLKVAKIELTILSRQKNREWGCISIMNLSAASLFNIQVSMLSTYSLRNLLYTETNDIG